MEYLFFLACVLAITLALVIVFSLAASRRRAGGLRRGVREAPGKVRADAPERGVDAPRTVEAPWGWPDNGQGVSRPGQRPESGESGDPVGRWVDQLLAQKRTVDDPEYRDRAQRSLRALVEDRYGNPGPMERSPRVAGDGPRQVSPRARKGTQARPAHQSLSGVKTPWGW